MAQQKLAAGLVTFLVLVLLLSSIFYVLIIQAGHVLAGGLFIFH